MRRRFMDKRDYSLDMRKSMLEKVFGVSHRGEGRTDETGQAARAITIAAVPAPLERRRYRSARRAPISAAASRADGLLSHSNAR